MARHKWYSRRGPSSDHGPHPLPVPVGVVEALLAKCDQQCTVPLTAMGVFTRGLKVRIKSGAFSGQVAEVHEIFAEGRDRIRVLLTLLGAEAELQLPSDAVEAA
jgi:transcription antitermination factor NusG